MDEYKITKAQLLELYPCYDPKYTLFEVRKNQLYFKCLKHGTVGTVGMPCPECHKEQQDIVDKALED